MLMVRRANGSEHVKKRLDAAKVRGGVLEMMDASATTGVAAGYLGRLCFVLNACIRRISERRLGTIARSFVPGQIQRDVGESLQRNALRRHGCAITASGGVLAWA